MRSDTGKDPASLIGAWLATLIETLADVLIQYDGLYVCILCATPLLLNTPSDGPDKGIIPQTCMELFERVASRKAADPNIDFTVEVSYIEVRVYLPHTKDL